MPITCTFFTTPALHIKRDPGSIPSTGDIIEIILKNQASPLKGKLNRANIKFLYPRDDENMEALKKFAEELDTFSVKAGQPGTMSLVVTRVFLCRVVSGSDAPEDIMEVNVSYICH